MKTPVTQIDYPQSQQSVRLHAVKQLGYSRLSQTS